MVETLEGATVVITGASSGIGQATAEAFAQSGARLVLAARGEAALQAVAQECRKLGAADVIVVPTDVTDAFAVRALAQRAREFGRSIDAWVSNVGVGAVGRFHETPITAHEQVVRINLIGHMNDAHAVMPIFIEQGHGIFINTISLGVFAATPFAAAHGASKFGLKGFSAALRAEMVEFPNIHICDVYPAFIDTPGISHGANYVGRVLTAPPPVYDARTVAKAMVGLALQPRSSTVIGSVAHAARFFHFLAPTISGWLVALLMQAYFRRAPKVATTDGNLFHSPAIAGGIDGGLRRRSEAPAGTIAVTAAAGLVLLYVANRRPAT
ncbi:SDR family oxidoreductase [Bradyrhizobium cenepequi]